MNDGKKTLVVIGAGASGFFVAVNAARLNPALKVIILEKTSKALSKVRVSGGGRCNVTHEPLELSEFIHYYPRGKNFLKKAFHHFSATDTANWFSERGVALKTEKDGRVFPASNKSDSIIDCLMAEAHRYGVSICYNCGIESIEKSGDYWILKAGDQRSWQTDFLCLATGGYQKQSQYQWIQACGLTIEKPVPSLFTFNIPQHAMAGLMGLSVPTATIKIVDSKLEESGPLLITHWGFSGPAVLKLSARGAKELAEKEYRFAIIINWLGKNENQLRADWDNYRQQMGNKKLSQNPFGIAARLWLYFLEALSIDANSSWSSLKTVLQNKLIHLLTTHRLDVQGKTTFKEEFVTCGGVSINDLDTNTMESKKLSQLFCVGEAINVDGLTGGFNFQNAWTTGWLAAKAIVAKSV